MRLHVGSTWDGHPAAPSEGATVDVEDGGDGTLLVSVDAPFHGDLPPETPAGSTDGLWEYEVVELFVAGAGDPVPYLEIELGPAGHHLVLALAGVRQVVDRGRPLAYAVERAGGRWRGVARIPRAWLPPGPHRVNAYAIHGRGPARRYLCATPLPGDKPDFHQPHRFPAVDLP